MYEVIRFVIIVCIPPLFLERYDFGLNVSDILK